MASFTYKSKSSRTVVYADAPVLEPTLRLRLGSPSQPLFSDIFNKAAKAADIEDKIRKGEDLTEQEIAAFNKSSKAQAHDFFDGARDRFVDRVQIYAEDNKEERKVKLEVKEGIFEWLKKLYDWFSEKLNDLLEKAKEGFQYVCNEVKELFIFLNSLF